MKRSTGSLCAVLLVCFPLVGLGAQPTKPDKTPIAATVETTLTTAEGQIRQFAFDGDPGTYFASKENPGKSDHFTLVLDKPVTVKSIQVTTGRPKGEDKLDAGTLEVSEDGKKFKEVAKFAEGMAVLKSHASKTRAVRIRPASDLKHPLAIREFVIDSDPAVTVFKYPVEFIVDVTGAPEMKEWAEKTARVCEREYTMINEELKSDGFKPRHVVTMNLANRGGVASANWRSGRINGSAQFFKRNPQDVGAFVHETVHIVQCYRGRNPGWLVEGIADYIRFFKYEPEKIGRFNPDRARYNGSYRVSARFLAYLTEKYDKEIVRKLNKLMREGKYKEEVFQELTGKTLPELGEEWKKSLSS